jgi:hypothetical protein
VAFKFVSEEFTQEEKNGQVKEEKEEKGVK